MRAPSYMYNTEIKDQIQAFMSENIKHDFIEGNREINLSMTVAEAQKLYAAGEELRALAESGELQSLHQRCVEQQKTVEKGYIKVMDLLDKTG